jgi:integrase
METAFQEVQETKLGKKKKFKPRARRGSGSILNMPGSRFFWIQYYRNGQRIRESSGSELKSVAQSILTKRLEEIRHGANPAISNKLTYEDIRKGLIDFYVAQNRKSLYAAKNEKKNEAGQVIIKKGEKYVWGLPNLDAYFKGYKIQNITVGLLKGYVTHRQEQGADGGTIKREFNILRSAFSVARKEGLLQYVPHFPMPKENAPRQGFVEPPQLSKIRENLPAHLHPLVTFLYETGCRTGAAKKITWSQVNLKTAEVTLPWTQTKNSSPLTLPLSAELRSTLKKPGFHSGNEPVFDATNFRKEWIKATKAAKLPEIVPHDLRRSAVRNMRKVGVSESVAMKISGHKTRAIFLRYDIVDNSDIHAAMKAVEKSYKSKP